MQNQRKTIRNGEPFIIAEGKLGAIVGFPMLVDSGSGHKEKTFERFVRPPGTRIIAIKDNKIFLQCEHRLEVKNEFDWRLPGGKVVDSFVEYKDYIDINKDMPTGMILSAGRKELREEAKLDSEKLSLFKKSSCGASVEWDLYYIIAEDVTDYANDHNEGEEIVDGKWFTHEEVLAMCKSGAIDEDRTVAILYQYINNK